MYQTLYSGAQTFFTMTEFKSDDGVVCRAPPISIINSSILTCRSHTVILPIENKNMKGGVNDKIPSENNR
jgi:hypothetical protein